MAAPDPAVEIIALLTAIQNCTTAVRDARTRFRDRYLPLVLGPKYRMDERTDLSTVARDIAELSTAIKGLETDIKGVAPQHTVSVTVVSKDGARRLGVPFLAVRASTPWGIVRAVRDWARRELPVKDTEEVVVKSQGPMRFEVSIVPREPATLSARFKMATTGEAYFGDIQLDPTDTITGERLTEIAKTASGQRDIGLIVRGRRVLPGEVISSDMLRDLNVIFVVQSPGSATASEAR